MGLCFEICLLVAVYDLAVLPAVNLHVRVDRELAVGCAAGCRALAHVDFVGIHPAGCRTLLKRGLASQ